jgi:hypothetical protein
MQKQTILLFDGYSVRKVVISEVYVDKKRNEKNNNLIITLEFVSVKNEEKYSTSKSLVISDRSPKSYDKTSGFKIITASGEYDEEVFLMVDDNKMKEWFTTVLEVFSGRKVHTRIE